MPPKHDADDHSYAKRIRRIGFSIVDAVHRIPSCAWCWRFVTARILSWRFWRPLYCWAGCTTLRRRGSILRKRHCWFRRRDATASTRLSPETIRRGKTTCPPSRICLRSAKVLEGALKNLNSDDRVDLVGLPQELTVGGLRANLSAKTIRNTSIIEVEYRSKNPQAAKNVVEAVIQSYLEFMDQMRKGTAGEISRVLTQERGKLAEKLNTKQEELLNARKNFADMGFRSEGKSLHPMVQRAVYFNDALIAAQKERVELDALQATIQTAVANNEDLGQYVLSVGDVVGREMLLNTLGLGSRDVYTQNSLEQNLITARAELQTAQQNLGPAHPQVVTLTERIQLIQQFLDSSQQRIGPTVGGKSKQPIGALVAANGATKAR